MVLTEKLLQSLWIGDIKKAFKNLRVPDLILRQQANSKGQYFSSMW